MDVGEGMSRMSQDVLNCWSLDGVGLLTNLRRSETEKKMMQDHNIVQCSDAKKAALNGLMTYA